MGEGKVFLLGVEAAFRGQPHGTYKLLFNSIYFGPSKPATRFLIRSATCRMMPSDLYRVDRAELSQK